MALFQVTTLGSAGFRDHYVEADSISEAASLAEAAGCSKSASEHHGAQPIVGVKLVAEKLIRAGAIGAKA